MFEVTTSAATIVAAILEGAGFYSHANILDNFTDFFDAGGELIFVASACFGILLTVLYGGYRPAVALIIGPALFYFLIGYRVEIDAPIKQLGDGKEVNVSKAVNLSLGNDPDEELKPAKISWFLAMTARLSSAITHTITTMIVEQGDEKELYLLTQEAAVTAIVNAEPSRSELQDMLSYGILKDCSKLLSAVYQLSSAEFSSEHEARMLQLASGTTNNPARAAARKAIDTLENRRTYWSELLDTSSTNRVKISSPMRDFMARETRIFAKTGEGRNYAEIFGTKYPDEPEKFISDELPQLVMACGDAMNVFADAALVQGDWIDKFVTGGTLESSMQDTPENRDLLCKSISEKMFGVPAEVEPCQLGSVAMLYIVRNLFSAGAISRASQMIVDRSNTTNTSLTDRCRDPDHSDEYDELCTTVDITSPSGVWKEINDRNSIDAEGLKQSIVSYALNIPYYQGILIYFLAVVFPFWSALVLVPGRAGAFLYLPLAWFWIKSWDIGFAIVVVLDRLLWNLVPSPRLLESGYTQYADLPTLLRSMAGVDLGGDIHANYYFVGMCMLAVPVISGYAFLRGRGEVLNIIYRAPGIAAKFDRGSFSQTELNSERTIWDQSGNEGANTNNAPANNTQVQTGSRAPALPGPNTSNTPATTTPPSPPNGQK